MANYSNLLAQIAANIYSNNNQEITGDVLKLQLNAMVASLGAGYQFMGVAHPADTPSGYADLKCFWLAGEAGTYTNFGGLVLNYDEVAVLKYNGSWSKEVTGAATSTELEQETSAVGGTIRTGFYKSDLTYQGLGGWTAQIYELDASMYDGIVVNAAPRSNGYVTLTKADNTILWQSNNAADFPKKLYFSQYPTAARIYVSNETANLASPSVTYFESVKRTIDKFVHSIIVDQTAEWYNGGYIDSNGDISKLSTWAAIIVDITDCVSAKITADFSGASSYVFLDDSAGNHLLSFNNSSFSDYTINFSQYPGAATLKVSSRKSSTHSLVLSKLKAPTNTPDYYAPVTLRRGSFDSNHIISLPSPFSSFPLPVKLSYYENCVGWNLSAQDYTKNNSYGATYFVSPNGDDDANGLTPSTPFLTIDKAIGMADVNTIILLKGTYSAITHFTPGLVISKDVNIIANGEVIIENSGNPLEITASAYIEGIIFKYGNSALNVTLRDEVCAFYRCKFLDSDNYNGLTALGGVCILEECEASNNLRDGFNYHKNTDGNYLSYALEINCTGFYNGVRHNSDINNGSTIHDAGVAIRILCTYGYCNGSAIAESNGADSYNIGVISFSTQNLTGDDTKKSNFGAQYNGCELYLVKCRSFGSKYDTYAETGSTIYRTEAFAKETGSGTYQLYTPSFV